MLFSALVNNPQKNPNIGFMERFSYGLGDFASQLLCTPAGAILIYYYTEVALCLKIVFKISSQKFIIL